MSVQNPSDPTKATGVHGNPSEAAGYVKKEANKPAMPSDESAQSLKQTMVSQGLVSEHDILDALAQDMGYEKVNLKDITVTPELLGLIEGRHAMKYKVFPIRLEGDDLYIALADPLNIQITDDLERITQKRIHPVLADEIEIHKFIAHYYEGNNIANLYGNVADEGTAVEQAANEVDEYAIVDGKVREEEQGSPIVRYVDLVFRTAVNDRASDIHIEPTKTGMTIRFRIDGVLHEYPAPPKKWQNSIISRLKVMSGMDLAEKRVPLDGRIKLNIPGKRMDVRVSSIPTIFGESIVMRLLDQSNVLMGLEDVGFLPDSIRMFGELIRRPNGVVLMTGPTGSGKTTTLYSALSTINNSETKIITLEDPVEYQLDGINQMQINHDANVDFGTGLRAILRQAPDVIMVGEMRDLETAEIGIRAALTGHLVFSTLHTNDAPSACVRLVDMGVKPFLVASSLQAVIAQRLARRICTQCKTAYTPTAQEIENAGYDPADYEGVSFYKGKGCDRCGNSGFRGRVAVHEIFMVTPSIRQMIMRVEASNKMKKVGISQGMRTLRMDCWEKALLGQTTISEVLRVTVED